MQRYGALIASSGGHVRPSGATPQTPFSKALAATAAAAPPPPPPSDGAAAPADIMQLQFEVADATMQTDAQPPPPDTHAVTDRQVRVEQRLSDLRIEQLRTSIVEEEQRAHRAREEELSRVLQAERDVIASLRNELDMLRKAEAERSAELSSALEGLLAAQKQLAARESDCSHWRTEAARAVGRLDTLAGHCEAQNERIRGLEAQIADQAQALDAARHESLLQHHALHASEERVSSVTSERLAAPVYPG